jgi:hypothetical protein
MHNIATVDSDSDTSRRVLTFAIILASRHDEDAIASDTETCKRSLTLLADVAMHRHEVFG